MPYERKGKCIYNKETGEKKGCSSTVGEAKAHMRTLYKTKKNIKEESSKMTQAILDRAEDIYQAMKAKSGRGAIKRYGADAEDVLRGRAMNISKKQVKMNNESKLKEIIRKKLSTPPTKVEEGRLEKTLTAAAIITALIMGDKMITSSDPELEKLEISYKKAKEEGDEAKMEEIIDKITKQEIFLSTGQGEPQTDIKEEIDYEGEMAKSELYRIIQNAKDLFPMLDDDTQLEGWIQSKITKSADYLNSVIQYLKYQSVKPTDEKLDYTLDK